MQGHGQATTAEGGKRERGAALVETAIIVPLLLLLVFGIIEYGLLFRDLLTISSGTRAGARVGSQAGADKNADYQVLQAVRAAVSKLPAGSLRRVVVYRAEGANGQVPDDCKTGTDGVYATCNVYFPADLDRTQAEFEDPLFTAKYPWYGADRQASLQAGADFIGVYIDIWHKDPTGAFGDRSESHWTVMQLESDPLQDEATTTTAPAPPTTTTLPATTTTQGPTTTTSAPPSTTTAPPTTTTTLPPTTTTTARPTTTTTARPTTTTTARPTTTTTRPPTTTTRPQPTTTLPPTTTTTRRRQG